MDNSKADLFERRPWLKYYDIGVPYEVNYPRYYAPDILRTTANNHPTKAAMWFYGTSTTFWELYLKVNRFANALIKLGVKRGDRVGLLLPNCPQFVISFWALLSAGAIVTNMNPMYTADELKDMAETTDMTALITFDGVLPNVFPLTDQFPIPLVIVTKITDFVEGAPVSTSEGLGLREGWYHFSEVLESMTNDVRPRLGITGDDPAVIQFTGGTTGVPKGATLSHSNLVAGIHECAMWGDCLMKDIAIERRTAFCVLPYFHIYGEICQMGWSIFRAATQILLPRFELAEVFDVLSKFEDITYFAAVPTMLTAIANDPRAKEIDFGRRCTFVCNGGGPCPESTIEKMLDLNVFYSEGWGMSETTSLGISNPVLGRVKPLSIGLPVIECDVRIMDPDTGEEVEQGQIGELVVKSPYVMMGYWNNPEETAKQLKDGWLHTGDLAYMDEEYYVFIVDRTKDMIIAGGYNIFPAEVDGVIFGYPKVADVMCVGIPHEYRGETLKAFIVPKAGETITAEEITEFCRTKLAAYKIPKEVEFRTELPRSSVGKALRRILREEEIAKQNANK
ncbi:MAG: long-chain fatty acid--CoA ligase [Syntrophomonadaceae bacterium]|nr:long-chain fatty acid--CoA ligase [Syntrophomonadaceae bacterium]